MKNEECGERREECGERSENTALRRCPYLKSWLILFSLLSPLSTLLSPHSSLLSPHSSFIHINAPISASRSFTFAARFTSVFERSMMKKSGTDWTL